MDINVIYGITACFYEFLSGSIPFMLILYYLKHRKPQYLNGKLFLSFLFAFYLIGVFYVTGVGTIYDALDFHPGHLEGRINLIPFSREINPIGYFLNVVMLVPFGFLVSTIRKESFSFGQALLSGFVFSLLIEISQIFSMRGTDVDDLITNTFGCAIGYLLSILWSKTIKPQNPLSQPSGAVIPVYIIAVFLGRFFLFNRRGLIQLFYG